MSFPKTVLTTTFVALCGAMASLLLTASVSAHDGPIHCKTYACGTISMAPKTVLNAIDPDPMPRVKRGDSQTITARWTVELGLKSHYALCLTANSSSGPTAADDCLPLSDQNANTTQSKKTAFEDTVTLPANLYRDRGWFYVRTTGLISPLGGPTATYDSNALPFEWRLHLPNLSAHSAKPSTASGTVYAEVEVRNLSSEDAGMFATTFMVNVCDAEGELDIRDPSESPLRYICRESTPAFIDHFIVQGPVQSGLISGSAVTVFTEISSRLPSAPTDLFISVSAEVDSGNDVDEDREDDNVDNGSRFISR